MKNKFGVGDVVWIWSSPMTAPLYADAVKCIEITDIIHRNDEIYYIGRKVMIYADWLLNVNQIFIVSEEDIFKEKKEAEKYFFNKFICSDPEEALRAIEKRERENYEK